MTSLQPINGCGEPRRANHSQSMLQSPVHREAYPPRSQPPASITMRHRLQRDLVIGRIYHARVAETLAGRDSSGRSRPPTGPRQEAVAVFLGRPAPSLPANQTLDSRQLPPRIGRFSQARPGPAARWPTLEHVPGRPARWMVLLPNKQQVALVPASCLHTLPIPINPQYATPSSGSSTGLGS